MVKLIMNIFVQMFEKNNLYLCYFSITKEYFVTSTRVNFQFYCEFSKFHNLISFSINFFPNYLKNNLFSFYKY